MCLCEPARRQAEAQTQAHLRLCAIYKGILLPTSDSFVPLKVRKPLAKVASGSSWAKSCCGRWKGGAVDGTSKVPRGVVLSRCFGHQK